jgi:hypothetical protein
MVETNQLLTKLQSEKDWNMSAVFTDKEALLTTNKLSLLPDELKYFI